jgi:hypothetical protein
MDRRVASRSFQNGTKHKGMTTFSPGVPMSAVPGSQRHEAPRGLDSEVIGARTLLRGCERQDSVQGCFADGFCQETSLDFLDTPHNVLDIFLGVQRVPLQVIYPFAGF